MIEADDYWGANLLAQFRKTPTERESSKRVIDKNLRITAAFQRWYTEGEFELSIGGDDLAELEFASLRLGVYARSGRGARRAV